jgi:hypothetical protein
VAVTLDNPKLAGQVQWDDDLGIYYYTYVDEQGLQRTVYIESAGSLGRKLELLRKYNVTNVNLQVPANNDVDPKMMDVLQRFQNNVPTASAPQGQMAVAYTIYGADGAEIGKQIRPLESPRVELPADMLSAAERIDAQIVNAEGIALTAPQSALLAVAAASAAKTTEAASEAAVAEVSLSTSQIVNLRQGPGTNYPVVGQFSPGKNLKVTARPRRATGGRSNMTAARPGSSASWSAPTATAITSWLSPNCRKRLLLRWRWLPRPPPRRLPPKPGRGSCACSGRSRARGRRTGGCTDGRRLVWLWRPGARGGQRPDLPCAGRSAAWAFNWFKQQIEWKRFEGAGPGQIDWGAMDEIVNSGSRGVSVLFSIVKAPAWAREPGFDGSVEGPPLDPQTYANFNGAVVRALLQQSLKAIEVWNEQNLHYEWGNKPLNPGEYVALLAPSYNAIKSACPSMLVISGALTPAGNNRALRHGRLHLSGGDVQGRRQQLSWTASAPTPAATTCRLPPPGRPPAKPSKRPATAFNGACDSPHHSWSFQSTMTGYRNIMNVYGGGNKLVWPTEFGWAAGGAYHPAYKYADDNDFTEQAQWTVEAYQMMKNWGWVGPAFLWNLNFRVVANGTELAQWGIVDPSWNPLPAYTALAQMPK